MFMNYNIYIFVLCFFGGICVSTFAQSDDVSYHKAPVTKDTSKIREYDWLQNVSVGGGFGLQIGSYTYIQLSPQISYHFTDWLSSGVGFSYMFIQYKDGLAPPISAHFFGGSVFTEAFFLRYLCAHVEYQLINYKEDWWKPNINNKRLWSNNLMVGGGYYQKPSDNYAIYLLLLYNFTDTPDQDVLGNPVVKAGFSIWLK
jgi:hypothetical protein